ncbi:MAG TPA: FkbM family methyltransferase, partial [Terrimicrobiaceae bacterium]
MNTRQKIAVAALLSRAVRRIRTVVGKENVGVFRRGGILWELDLKEGIDFAIFLQGGFEPETLRYFRRVVRPGFVVLDIGGNIGSHALPLAQMVGPTGRVYTFEPTDYAFGKQRRNLCLNPELSKRVRAVQAMLVGGPTHEKPRTIPSSWPLDGETGKDVHPIHLGRFNTLEGAQVFSLDDWVAEERPAAVDFIKIDVDGYEIDVVEGARETLSRYKPLMMMEFAPYIFSERGRSFKELLDALSALGYNARTVTGKVLALEPS